jgi:hypothetical protein
VQGSKDLAGRYAGVPFLVPWRLHPTEKTAGDRVGRKCRTLLTIEEGRGVCLERYKADNGVVASRKRVMAHSSHDMAPNYIGRIWTTLLGILLVPVYIEFSGIKANGLVGYYLF